MFQVESELVVTRIPVYASLYMQSMQVYACADAAYEGHFGTFVKQLRRLTKAQGDCIRSLRVAWAAREPMTGE